MAAIARCNLARKISLFSARICISSSIHSSPVREAILIKMPSLSPTMTSGVIVNWNKKPGEAVNPGDVLCEIQTDKAVMAFELEEEGTLARIMGPDDGKECVVGVPIAVLAEPGEAWQTVASTFKVEDTVQAADVQNLKADIAESQEEVKKAEAPLKQSKALGPATRMLLQRYGLTPSQIPATGPKGLLLKGDVLNYVKKENLAPVPNAPTDHQVHQAKATSTVKAATKKSKPSTATTGEILYQDINLSPSEVEAATKVLSSKVNIAHSYGSIDCNTGNIRSLCQQYQKEGVQVSTIDVVVKAVSMALSLCPEMCATTLNGKMALPSTVDVSVASVSEDGLYVSNIVDSPSRGIEEISSLIRNKAERPQSPAGGSFMVLNLGESGVESCKAVISAPQCAALTVGAEQMTLDDDANISTSMIVSLSFDGEAIPVETASRFLGILKGLVESPNTIVLGQDIRATDDAELLSF